MAEKTSSSKKVLSKIKSGALSRGFALAKVTLNVGGKAASHALGGLFSNDSEKAERLKQLLIAQAGVLTREFGQLKGSVMKVGQMLSVYGEYFLPPEVNDVLKSLQFQSPPLDWKEVRKQLVKELGEAKLALLEIDPESFAAASLGQVHLATRKSDGRKLALKVQYPGVDRAVDGDLKNFRSILNFSKIIPAGERFDSLFDEVREMLHREVDYRIELVETRRFRELLKDDPRFVVPEVFEEFSSQRVLATSFEEGVPVDSDEVKALSQARRNGLGTLVLELYLRELLVFHRLQTDPHYGNYRVRLGEKGEADRLVLLDFGAVREFSADFMIPYTEMMRGAFLRDPDQIIEAGKKLAFILPEDSPELLETFTRVCVTIAEPFATTETEYDFGKTDLPKRLARQGTELAVKFRLRPPPREIVFLDRKAAGVFFFLAGLKAKLNARGLIQSYLID
jgi:predicted unusual protein kinase regulating ubiquinone biosynthesis (AarF/ABC1/UbiB family)